MNNESTQREKSNSLVYRTSKTNGKENIFVSIRLNDECKNGHQDFAITGDIYEAGKPKTDRYFISGGCIHEEILKAFPEFKIFVNLHLCDYKGVPMHPTANGFYHLTNGFNNTKPYDAGFKTEFCEYYRISAKQFDKLATAKNVTQYALILQKENILEQWEKEANEAIKILENLTGKKFLVDSKRTQFIAPTKEEIAEEEKRQHEGYYTPEAAQKRREARREDIIKKLEAERDKEIKKATIEFEVKRGVLNTGGEDALNNCIFYNHTNTLAFNWRGYNNISESLIQTVKDHIILPEGVTIENRNK